MLVSNPGTISVPTRFTLFALLRQVLLKVMLSTDLYVILVEPPWPRKECFIDMLALLVEELQELPLLWNFLVQPHIRKFHSVMEML